MAITNRGKVSLPDSGIIIRRSGKYRYVYKVIKTYRSDSGKPTNKRKPIGKLDEESGLLIPNTTYWELYTDKDVPESFLTYDNVRSIGATFVVSQILNKLEVTQILKSVFEPKTAQLILTATVYMVCRGNIFERILDWCEGYTLNETPLNSTTATVLFGSISFDERMNFFKKWVSKNSNKEAPAYDVTSFSTYSSGINDAE